MITRDTLIENVINTIRSSADSADLVQGPLPSLYEAASVLSIALGEPLEGMLTDLIIKAAPDISQEDIRATIAEAFKRK